MIYIANQDKIGYTAQGREEWPRKLDIPYANLIPFLSNQKKGYYSLNPKLEITYHLTTNHVQEIS